MQTLQAVNRSNSGVFMSVNTGKRPVLSISLLCAGKRPDDTKKCLDSLTTIKEQLPTEIIIVDTGCDEKMHQTLCEYADEVIRFTWCDDFAKARNAGLSRCSGEWFMYIDDDEWFDDTDALVSFFTSGEYREYGHADHMIRNYLDPDGKEYDTAWICRLTKLTPETRFTGKIHEYLTPLTGRCAKLQCFSHHYGYVYLTEKDHYTKAIRNIRPLLELVRKEPENLHWACQLVQEYIAVGEYAKLADLSEEYIGHLSDLDDTEINRIRTDFYFGKLWADNKTYQYEETIKDFNRFRKDRRNTSVCQAALYFSVVTAYYETKDYDNALRYAQKYIGLYDEWTSEENYEAKLGTAASLTTGNVFSERKIIPLLSILISSGLKGGHIEVLHRWFGRLSDQDEKEHRFTMICDVVTEAFSKEQFDPRFVRYADAIFEEKESARRCAICAKQIEDGDSDEDRDRFSRIIEVFGQTANGANYYLDYLRLLYSAKHEPDRVRPRLGELVLKTNDFFNLNPSVWQVAASAHIDLEAVFKTIPFRKWFKATEEFFDRHTPEETAEVRKLMSGFSDTDIRMRYFHLKELESEIVNEKDFPKAAGLLKKYCLRCVSFYREIYATEQFDADEESTILPDQCVFALRFISAGEDTKKLLACRGIFAAFDEALDAYIKECDKLLTIVFIFCRAASLAGFQKVIDMAQADPGIRVMIVPVPYMEKTGGIPSGDVSYDGEIIAGHLPVADFENVDLKAMHPQVIFVDEHMNQENTDYAVPAEYYSTTLKQYTDMLICLPYSTGAAMTDETAAALLAQIAHHLHLTPMA